MPKAKLNAAIAMQNPLKEATPKAVLFAAGYVAYLKTPCRKRRFMTPAETAAEFACKCLQWREAFYHKSEGGRKACIKPTVDKYRGHNFLYTDNREVLKLVRLYMASIKDEANYRELRNRLVYAFGEWLTGKEDRLCDVLLKECIK